MPGLSDNLEQSFTYEALGYNYTNLKDQYSKSSSHTRNKTLIIPKQTYNKLSSDLKTLDIKKYSRKNKLKTWIKTNI